MALRNSAVGYRETEDAGQVRREPQTAVTNVRSDREEPASWPTSFIIQSGAKALRHTLAAAAEQEAAPRPGAAENTQQRGGKHGGSSFTRRLRNLVSQKRLEAAGTEPFGARAAFR